MRPVRRIPLLATVVLAGCMATTPPPEGAHAPPAGAEVAASPLGSPFAASPGTGRAIGTPLVIDRTDLRIGTTVQFARVPNRQELHDLGLLPNVAHVVLQLPQWPAEYADLQQLDQLPPECDLIVLLPGYPPSRGAAEAWNQVRLPTRLIVVVDTPPPSLAMVQELNAMRGLDRVIAQLDDPARSGFELLQRPLSFRKVIE